MLALDDVRAGRQCDTEQAAVSVAAQQAITSRLTNPLSALAAVFGVMAGGATPGVHRSCRQDFPRPMPTTSVDLFMEDPNPEPRAAVPRRAWLTKLFWPRSNTIKAAAHTLLGESPWSSRDEEETWESQRQKFTAWLVTFADEPSAASHSPLPPHPSHCLLVAHDGRAVLAPVGSLDPDGDPAPAGSFGVPRGARQTAPPRERTAAEIRADTHNVWWRACGPHDHSDPQAKLWGAPAPAAGAARECEWCGRTFPTVRGFASHRSRGCTEAAPLVSERAQLAAERRHSAAEEARARAADQPPRRSARRASSSNINAL